MSVRGNGSVWIQKEFSISGKSRGCHYITDEVKKELPELQQIKIGLLHLFSK